MSVFANLDRQSFVVIDDAFDPQTIASLRALAVSMAGTMRDAGVGRGTATMAKSIRSDRIVWLESSEVLPPVRAYFERIHEFRIAINRQYFLGADEIEAHFSHYPPGAHYSRHLDRFRDDDARVISTVLYLNPDWTPGDGGELRLYPVDAERIDIEPIAGRLILFLSAELEHEVLPTRVDRYSIAGWMRRRR